MNNLSMSFISPGSNRLLRSKSLPYNDFSKLSLEKINRTFSALKDSNKNSDASSSGDEAWCDTFALTNSAGVYYDYICGTTKSADAQIIFFGNDHSLELQLAVARGKMIAGMARSGDIVLTEGDFLTKVRTDQEKNQHFFYGQAAENLTYLGWDKINEYKDAINIEYNFYKLIASENADEKNQQDLQQKRLFLFNKRNDSLVEMIQQVRAQYPDRKVFVIAGQNHVCQKVLDNFQDELYCVFNPSMEGDGEEYKKIFYETVGMFS